jgi:uncharacterized protein (TIGR03000 family)
MRLLLPVVFFLVLLTPLASRAQYASGSNLNGWYGWSGQPGPYWSPLWGGLYLSPGYAWNANNFYRPLPAVYGAAKDFPQNPLPPGYTPRFATKDVKSRYAAAAADPVWESHRQLATIGLFVYLPCDNCAVSLEGVPMPAGGTMRRYESPKLDAGEYRYTVTATIDGQPVTKTISGKPGEMLTVDFRK